MILHQQQEFAQWYLSGCNVDGGVLASFDVDGDFLEQEIDFTFEDFSNPTKFTQLAGMQ